MDLQQLIKDCVRQKPAAQRELYNLLAPAMLGVCYRYTKSYPDAEDVMQEGFVKMFKHISDFKHAGEFGGWVRRIMVTTALNYLKKNKRYRAEMVFTAIPLHPVVDNEAACNLGTKEMADLIRQLPTGFQTIFNLYAIEGYTHVEIGQMLGISEGTSKSQYARARYLLMEWIAQLDTNLKNERYAGK
jgi:RNA polymerase sigma factor (sigma-70 family)